MRWRTIRIVIVLNPFCVTTTENVLTKVPFVFLTISEINIYIYFFQLCTNKNQEEKRLTYDIQKDIRSELPGMQKEVI